MKQLEGRIALVTGASSGIGRATAIVMARSSSSPAAARRATGRRWS